MELLLTIVAEEEIVAAEFCEPVEVETAARDKPPEDGRLAGFDTIELCVVVGAPELLLALLTKLWDTDNDGDWTDDCTKLLPDGSVLPDCMIDEDMVELGP